MDRGISALLEDLQAQGMLDDTLIVMLGEMGRTPKVSALNRSPGAKAGRDHWGAVQTVFIAGGGVPGGRVIGRFRQKWGLSLVRSPAPREPCRDDLSRFGDS